MSWMTGEISWPEVALAAVAGMTAVALFGLLVYAATRPDSSGGTRRAYPPMWSETKTTVHLEPEKKVEDPGVEETTTDV